MAAEEREIEIRRSIEEKLGVEEASYVIAGRPPGGWDTIVTKEYLDLRLEVVNAHFEALEGRIQRQITRLIMWLVPTIFGGLTVFGAIVGAFD